MLPKLTSSLDSRFASILLKILERHDLTTNELVLKVRVDNTSCLGRLGTSPDRPSTDLIRPTSKVPDEIERVVTGLGDLGQRASSTRGFLFLLLLFGGEANEALFEGNRERDEEISGVVLIDPGLDFGEPLVLLADKVALGEVDEVGDGLGGEELEAVDNVDLRYRQQVK